MRSNGEQFSMWRAADYDGDVLDSSATFPGSPQISLGFEDPVPLDRRLVRGMRIPLRTVHLLPDLPRGRIVGRHRARLQRPRPLVHFWEVPCRLHVRFPRPLLPDDRCFARIYLVAPIVNSYAICPFFAPMKTEVGRIYLAVVSIW